MVYKLITTWDVGRTREEFVNYELQASDLQCTNSLSVLPTLQVVYQPINHETCGLLLLYN